MPAINKIDLAEEFGRTDVALWAEVTALDALTRTEGARDARARGARILGWATEQGDTRLASRCHALLAMTDLMAGLSGAGAEHATIAVTLLDGTELPRLRAKLLTRQAVEAGLDALVVVGGDGMVHLGVNVVAGTDLPLGIVAAGTGNDIARALALPMHDVEASVRRIERGLETGPRPVDAVAAAPPSGGQDE